MINSLTIEHSKIVLQKLLDVVDAGNVDDFDFKKDNWYRDYTWTEEQEGEFIQWLAKFLKKHKYSPKRGRRHYPDGTSRSIAEHDARKIVFNYGWKTEE